MAYSSKTMKITIVVLLLLVGGFVGYRFLNSTAEPEILLLPADYRGPVYILFNQSTGKLKSYDGNARVFEVPSNGILKSQFGPNSGLQNPPKFFYVENNTKTELAFSARLDPGRGNDVYVCCISDGTATGESGRKVDYARFFVGTTNEIKTAMELSEKTPIATLRDDK
jgi:hypothetical protein